MNVNWPRWIKASIRRHVKTILGECTLILEGQERKDSEPLTRYELRIDGPDIDEVADGEFELSIYINLLIMTERSNTQLYTHDNSIGLAQSSLSVAMSVFKTDDNNEQIGCMHRMTPVTVMRFDTLMPQNVDCSTVEAEYKLSLTED